MPTPTPKPPNAEEALEQPNTGAKVFILTVFLLALLFAAAAVYLQLKNRERLAGLIRPENWLSDPDEDGEFELVDAEGEPLAPTRYPDGTRRLEWLPDWEAPEEFVDWEMVQTLEQIRTQMRKYNQRIAGGKHVQDDSARKRRIQAELLTLIQDKLRAGLPSAPIVEIREPKVRIVGRKSARFEEHLVTVEFKRNRDGSGGINRWFLAMFMLFAQGENPFLTVRDFRLFRKDGEDTQGQRRWAGECTFVWYEKAPKKRARR